MKTSHLVVSPWFLCLCATSCFALPACSSDPAEQAPVTPAAEAGLDAAVPEASAVDAPSDSDASTADAGDAREAGDATDSAVAAELPFSKVFGSPGMEHGYDIAVAPNGDIVLAGFFKDTIDFGTGELTSAGDDDIFVARLDATGKALWAKRFGDNKSQQALRLAVDASGDIYLTGSFHGTLDFGSGALTVPPNGSVSGFVAKLSATGAASWAKAFGTDAIAYEVAIDPQGAAVVAGRFAGTADLGCGSGPLKTPTATDSDAFAAKLDGSGTCQFAKSWGDASDQLIRTVSVDATGGIFVAGNFFGAIDLGGGALTSAGQDDIFVAKLDSQGAHVWSKRFGDDKRQGVRDTAVASDGSLYMIGVFDGTVDFGSSSVTNSGEVLKEGDTYVAKFSAQGVNLWSRAVAGAGIQAGFALAVDAKGRPVVTGGMENTVDVGCGSMKSGGWADVFVARWNADDGSCSWSKSYAGAGDDMGFGVAARGESVVVVGDLMGGVDFGDGQLPYQGATDVFVVRIATP